MPSPVESTSSRAFQPSGVVTLTTDFGSVDPYVGIMHGVILTRAPGARIVDVCHAVPPQDVARAAYFLGHARAYFPAGTVHVAVVDPGVGSTRRILVADDDGSAFLAPDNGLLASVLTTKARVRALDVERFALPARSRTFHGRDVFAPAAAAIASGLEPLAAGIGPEFVLEASPPPRARVEGDRCAARVLFADHFGNLVLDAHAGDLSPEPSAWSAFLGDLEVPVRGTYADVAQGQMLALVDSFGALEIAVRGGSAAAQTRLGVGDGVTLRRIR